MLALRVHDHLGPDGLRLDEVPDLAAREGRVLLEVRAAGVSFADTLLVVGRYQVSPPLPFTPGFDCAGVVLDAPDASGLAPGDEVVAFTGQGGMAQLALAEPHLVFPKPAGLSWAQAGGFVGNAQTAYLALVVRGRVCAGEVVVVHGAAGGVGSLAVQVAAAVGARVIAVVSTPEKAAAVREAAGCEVVVGEGWADEVRRLAPGGVDVVLDPVGGARSVPSLKLLRSGGRLLVVGFTAGEVPSFAAHRVLLANVDVVGVAWPPAVAADPELPRAMHAALAAMVEAGTLRPPVGAVLPLADGAEAVRALGRREGVGKLVLDVPALAAPPAARAAGEVVA